MKRLFASVVALVFLGACGGRHPMDGKGSILFWNINSSAVTFANCSDDPHFIAGFPSILPVGSTFVYRLAKDGQSATTQSCQSLDPNTCQDDTSAVFQVAGNQLILSQSLTSQVGTTQCNLADSRSWELTDQGQTLQMVISDTLGLTGSATDCQQVDQAQKDSSPNGKGVQGCIVNNTADAGIG